MTEAQIARRRRAVVAFASLGVVVMVVFDAWYTLFLGLVLMLGSVAAATVLVARPDGFLDHDRPDDRAQTADTDASA